MALIVLAAGALAQEPEPPAAADDQEVTPWEEQKRVVVKRYTELAGDNLLRAVKESWREDVRFQSSFDSRLPRLARNLRRIELGGRSRGIAAAFMTENQLCCLIAQGDQETVRRVAGLTRGQIITVEGVVAGPIGLRNCILVDRVLTGEEAKPTIEHELVLGWPGVKGVKPQLMVKPGEYAVEFPCAWQKDAVERFTVIVEQKRADAFKEELRQREKEGDEGDKEPPEKQYVTFEPRAVYGLAKASSREKVRFVDGFVSGNVPESRALRSLPRGRLRPLRIGYVFDTKRGLTCAVPASSPLLVERALRIVPGQSITIEGMVYGPRDGFRVVLVDNIEFPGVKGKSETADIWVVRVIWPGERPKLFYEIGTYRVALPCQFVEGRKERLIAELREVRVTRVPEKEGEGEGTKPPEAPPGP